MKLREVIEDVVNEAASGRHMDRLRDFLERIAKGNLSQQGMLSLGFNLRSPIANNESETAKSLAAKLNINITEDDMREVLKEIGLKSVSDLVKKWNESVSDEGKGERVEGKRREGGKEGF